MRMHDFFNIKRFYLLIKRDFYTQYKTYLLGLGSLFCILFIINISSIASYKSWNFNLVFYPLTLFIGGYIFTGFCFNELHHEQSRLSYLALPASGCEKLLSKLVITSIGYILVSMLLFLIFSLIMFLLNKLLFGIAHPVFHPFHPVILLCIRIYLVTHSLFFLGAIFFRKNCLLKTILSLSGLAIVFILVNSAVVFLLYVFTSFNTHIYFSLELFTRLGQEGFHYPLIINDIAKVLSYTVHIIFWFIMAPLLWIIAYFRLKEIEV